MNGVCFIWVHSISVEKRFVEAGFPCPMGETTSPLQPVLNTPVSFQSEGNPCEGLGNDFVPNASSPAGISA
jgi:hypothetical protein